MPRMNKGRAPRDALSEIGARGTGHGTRETGSPMMPCAAGAAFGCGPRQDQRQRTAPAQT